MSQPASPPKASREAVELSLLQRISRLLDGALSSRQAVSSVLEAMADEVGMMRPALVTLDQQTGEMAIEAAYGLSVGQQRRGRYRFGEGVTGKVLQTSEPAVIPRVSQEPLFLNRTGARSNLSGGDIAFICVPIKLGSEVVGALSADRLAVEGVSYERDVRLLSIIASMIARAVRSREVAQHDRQRLTEQRTPVEQGVQDGFRPSNIIGHSKAMLGVYDLLAQVCNSDATVLIRGESGVGKELVAQAIHDNSPRAQQAFVKVNCAALPETILESELFGHEKGAFTGAIAQRKGRFELAHGGTIFLDEVGDLATLTQIRLLRVLQEREFERVGGMETIQADVRVITATNRDLEKLVADGSFRQDLYYRLNVFPIHVPPLRERKADILLLADHFVQRYSQANNKSIRRISTPAIDMLTAYHWPGNVRELENCVERAVLVSQDDVIHGHHLPPTLQTAEASGTTHDGTLQAALERLERELIFEALQSARGNKARAARALGITERIMGLRVAKHGINPRRFRTFT